MNTALLRLASLCIGASLLTLMQGCATSSSIAYVSNADSRDISVVKIDRNAGTTQLVQTLDVGGMVMPMALSPDKRMLYAALRSEPYSVASFTIDGGTGSLKRVGTAPLPDSMANIMVDRTG